MQSEQTRSRLQVVGLIVAVALLGVVGVGIAVARNSSDPPWYVGGQWRLVSIEQSGQKPMRVPLPPDPRSGIGIRFQEDRQLVMWDGVRPVNTSFDATQRSFRITGDGVGGLVADTGRDPLLAAVSAAVATMLRQGATTAVSQNPEGGLVLDSDGFRLVLAPSDAALPTASAQPGP